jgi:hypothetical protein
LYIFKLISGLLLADVAINLHKSFKCVPSSFKDFVHMATTACGARAAAFTVFLALVLFVLCLMAIMLLAEEYESLFSCMEEDKGNCSLLKPVLNPHCGCLGDAPGRHGARFYGERRSYTRPSFQWSIHVTISIRLITHHFIQMHDAILSSRLGYLLNKLLATSFVGCRNIICSQIASSCKSDVVRTLEELMAL